MSDYLKIDYKTLFKIMKILRGDESELFEDDKINSIISNQFNESKKFYNTVINQPTHSDPLKDLMIQWYSAWKSMMELHKNMSDIDIINTDLLLDSFGYPYAKYHSDVHKKNLAKNINSMFARKCEPKVLYEILRSFNYNNVYIFEVWLRRKKNELFFTFEPVVKMGDIYVSDDRIAELKLSWDEFEKIKDVYWGYDRDDIMKLEKSNDISIKLPSMTPYFGIAIASNWLRTDLSMAWINRKLRLEINDWIYGNPTQTTGESFDPIGFNPNRPQQNLENGTPTSWAGNVNREIYIESYGGYISLMELMLSINTIWREVYERDTTKPMPNNLKHFELQLPDDEYLDDTTLLVDAYNECHQRTSDRSLRDIYLQQQAERFHGNNPFMLENKSNSYGPWIEIVNKDFYDFAVSQFETNIDGLMPKVEKLAIELISALDDYLILHNFPPINMINSIVTNYNQTHIKDVIDYFKPIHSRLLKFVYDIEIKDLPGDCMPFEDKLFIEVYNNTLRFYEYFRNYIHDKYYDKISMTLFEDFNRDGDHGGMFDVGVGRDEIFQKINLTFFEDFSRDGDHKGLFDWGVSKDELSITITSTKDLTDIDISGYSLDLEIWSDNNSHIIIENNGIEILDINTSNTHQTYNIILSEKISTLKFTNKSTTENYHINLIANIINGNGNQSFTLNQNEYDILNIYKLY